MVMIGSNPSSSSVNNLFRMPQLAVRVVDDADTVSNRSTGLVGEIRPELIPLSMTKAPGPTGGTLTLQHAGEYYIKSGRRQSQIEDWRGKTITLEERRNVNNRALQRVLFKGKVAAIGHRFDRSSNGVTLHVRDWYPLSDAPVYYPYSEGKTVGQLCQVLRDSNYYERYLDSGRVRARLKLMPQYLFPTDSNGNPTAGVDENLLTSNVVPASLRWEGQPLSQAFSDLVNKAFGGYRIPDLEYDGGFVRMVARERGRNREICVGSPGAVNPSYTRLATVTSITGQTDYSRSRNRAYGIGGNVQRVAPMALEKNWSDADEATVKANPKLNETPRYFPVFREYRASDRFFNAALPHSAGGDSFAHDQIRWWRRANTAGADTGWSEVFPEWEIRKARTDGDTESTLVSNLRDVTPKEFKDLVVFFPSPQRFDYWTPSQIALRQAGENPGPANIEGYSFEVETILIEDPVEMDTGIIGDDLERPRTALIKNPYVRKVYHDGHYTTNADGTRSDLVEDAPSGLEVDETVYFLAQLLDFAAENGRPAIDIRITLALPMFDWLLGDRVYRMYSNLGEILFDNLPWFVQAITYDFTRWTTTLELSMVHQNFGGAVVGVG